MTKEQGVKIVRYILVFVALATLAGCAYLPRGAAVDSEVLRNSASPDADFAVYALTRESVPILRNWPAQASGAWPEGEGDGSDDTLIRPGDSLTIAVWDSSDNSLLSGAGQRFVALEEVSVAKTGTVFIPYLDEIEIAGTTPAEARATLQNELSIIQPGAQVQLVHIPGRQNSVTVASGVAAPGRYPLLASNHSVLEMLTDAGGVPPQMRNPRVKLIRDGSSYEISLSKLNKNPGLDRVLQGGDRIVVQQDPRYFQAFGAAQREELFYFTKDEINALEAVSLVGGLSDNRANPQGVLILREYEPGQVSNEFANGPEKTDVVFTLDLATADGLFSAKRFEIQSEDVVLVTEATVTAALNIIGLIRAGTGLTRDLRTLEN